MVKPEPIASLQPKRSNYKSLPQQILHQGIHPLNLAHPSHEVGSFLATFAKVKTNASVSQLSGAVVTRPISVPCTLSATNVSRKEMNSCVKALLTLDFSIVLGGVFGHFDRELVSLHLLMCQLLQQQQLGLLLRLRQAYKDPKNKVQTGSSRPKSRRYAITTTLGEYGTKA